MPEKDKIFSSKIKYVGVFGFTDFYRFCYEWLVEEMGMAIMEDKYIEKLSGDSKNIDVEWTGSRKVTDYFKFEVKVAFRIIGLKKIEVQRGNAKVKTDEGSVEVKLAANLIRDYEGKFEKGALSKFMRAIYEKWVIPARVGDYEDKLAGDADEFLAQVKAYLDLEGKK